MISFAAGLIFIAAARRGEKRPSGAPRKLPRLGLLAIISIAVIAGVIWLGAEGVLNRVIGTID
jgi:hypothetical protein